MPWGARLIRLHLRIRVVTNGRGVGRRGVLASVARGLNVALRGIWKWAIIIADKWGHPLGSKEEEGQTRGMLSVCRCLQYFYRGGAMAQDCGETVVSETLEPGVAC